MILRISPVFCLVLALVAFAQIQASAAPNDDEEEGTQWFKLMILRRKFKKGQVENVMSYLTLNAYQILIIQIELLCTFLEAWSWVTVGHFCWFQNYY